MIAAPRWALAAALIAFAPRPAGAQGRETWELGVDLEYSAFLDVHRETLKDAHRGPPVGRFAPRLGATWRARRFAIGGALSIYAEGSVAASAELFVAYAPYWRHLSLLVGGGTGVLYTHEDTLIPTQTNTRSGPLFFVGARLRWHVWSALFVSGGLSLYAYPAQPLYVVPVGVDLRWSVGVGWVL